MMKNNNGLIRKIPEQRVSRKKKKDWQAIRSSVLVSIGVNLPTPFDFFRKTIRVNATRKNMRLLTGNAEMQIPWEVHISQNNFKERRILV